MPKGGYRKPNNPAPVSGPGKLSRRTDGGPTQAAKYIPAGGKYGEASALRDMQQSAPMQGNPTPNMPTPNVPAQSMPTRPSGPVTGLFDPTPRPGEPLTAGMPFGDGSNVPTVVPPQVDDVAAQIRAAYAVYPNEPLRRLVIALDEAGR